MISKTILEQAMYEAMVLAATRLPPDIRAALQAAGAEETDPMARRHLKASLDNADAAERGCGLICADTGFPMFFVRARTDTVLEGGFAALTECSRNAVARATKECYLRPTMVDPLTRGNPGDNLGSGMPRVKIDFAVDGNALEVIAAPKGGGSEIFGTFYQMLYPSDGVAGIKNFIIEKIRDACYAGKICPPAIIGVGIGGTADLCMERAKHAALLRPVGRRHERADVAELEQQLLAAARQLGIGPMGARGINAVLAVNIEIAVTHTAALPVAFNAQCLVGRRWRAVIDDNQQVTLTGEIR